MASAHHAAQQQRYPQTAHNEFRLPSLKDLNFTYRHPPPEPSPLPTSAGPVESNVELARHPPQAWGRTNPHLAQSPITPHQQHPQQPHQQHTPPLSANSELAPAKVEYTSKHDNAGYLTPGMPLSAQTTPIPGSVNIGSRGGEDVPQNPYKRVRTSSSSMGNPREARPPHVSIRLPLILSSRRHIYVFL